MHTKIDDVYEIIEQLIGDKGIMTHQIPSAVRALEPILKTRLTKEWFDKVWLKEGLDEEVEVEDLTLEELDSFWREYGSKCAELWDKIRDEAIIVKT